MKNFIFATLALLFFPFAVFAQGEWSSNQKRTGGGNLKSIGLFANAGITNIYRNTNELPALGEGNFEGGVSLGKNLAFVVKGGLFTQSDFFVSQGQSSGSWGNGYQNSWSNYNADCGCYGNQGVSNSSSSNRFQYLRIGFFQIGLSQQGKKHGVRLTGGIGGFDYQIPFADSLGNETAEEIARGTVFALGFDLKTKVGKDMFNARLQSFTDVNNLTMEGTIGKIEADYLVGLEDFNGKFYVGLGGAAKKHVVSGDEYSARVIAEFGHNEIPFWMRIHFGIAYNPVPSEGTGFEFGFQVSLDRFAKSIYR
jgi:hypothetical protein